MMMKQSTYPKYFYPDVNAERFLVHAAGILIAGAMSCFFSFVSYLTPYLNFYFAVGTLCFLAIGLYFAFTMFRYEEVIVENGKLFVRRFFVWYEIPLTQVLFYEEEQVNRGRRGTNEWFIIYTIHTAHHIFTADGLYINNVEELAAVFKGYKIKGKDKVHVFHNLIRRKKDVTAQISWVQHIWQYFINQYHQGITRNLSFISYCFGFCYLIMGLLALYFSFWILIGVEPNQSVVWKKIVLENVPQKRHIEARRTEYDVINFSLKVKDKEPQEFIVDKANFKKLQGDMTQLKVGDELYIAVSAQLWAERMGEKPYSYVTKHVLWDDGIKIFGAYTKGSNQQQYLILSNAHISTFPINFVGFILILFSTFIYFRGVNILRNREGF